MDVISFLNLRDSIGHKLSVFALSILPIQGNCGVNPTVDRRDFLRISQRLTFDTKFDVICAGILRFVFASRDFEQTKP